MTTDPALERGEHHVRRIKTVDEVGRESGRLLLRVDCIHELAMDQGREWKVEEGCLDCIRSLCFRLHLIQHRGYGRCFASFGRRG